uniref:Uncharacterized protein n=1 Tax=Hemiselmis andersenii TaxID=464988 RepID=A0A7S1EEY8_HEMAN|mmetsp:Transcript_47180/g.114670  ORF Transcript_47180/g.114670 Transcript_47180/m.114670 type:complete len:216 (+) Transcript_47180:65-712(+)
MFPRTHAQLTSGRFRWISYCGGVLRVCLGRAGKDSKGRACPTDRVAREWRLGGGFQSLHQMFCAVEASWLHLGESGTPRTLGDSEHVPGIDHDMSPSIVVKQPLGRKEDAKVIKPSVKKAIKHSASVTAVSFAGEDILFCGFADGTISKWSVPQKQKLGHWEAHASEVIGLVLSPDRNTIFSFAHAEVLRAWYVDITSTLELSSFHSKSMCRMWS